MRALCRLSLAITCLAAGCMTGDGMQTKLRDASTEYNKSLRWRDLDRAAEYLPAESQQAFLARQEEYAEDLVVVDYELTRLDLDKATGVAASRAQIWWHLDDSTIVKNTVVDQLWQFHEGKFVLVDERRASGTRLGLFAEREGAHPYLPGLKRYRKAHDVGADKKKLGKKKPPPEPTISWPAGDGVGKSDAPDGEESRGDESAPGEHDLGSDGGAHAAMMPG